MYFTADDERPGQVAPATRMDVVQKQCLKEFTGGLSLEEYIDTFPETFIRVHELSDAQADEFGINTGRSTSPTSPTEAFNAFIQEQNEVSRNMALLFFWDAMAMQKLKPGGVCSATKPAPLSAGQIKDVFRQLRKHPVYDAHQVISISEDGEMVHMTPESIDIVDEYV